MPEDPKTSRLWRYAEPALVAAVLGAVYLIVAPTSADHAAQVFRSGLFESEGLSTWNNFWFGGHHTPGYSVLFPFLGSLLGPRGPACSPRSSRRSCSPPSRTGSGATAPGSG
jgi:hypothetical protein